MTVSPQASLIRRLTVFIRLIDSHEVIGLNVEIEWTARHHTKGRQNDGRMDSRNEKRALPDVPLIQLWAIHAPDHQCVDTALGNRPPISVRSDSQARVDRWPGSDLV